MPYTNFSNFGSRPFRLIDIAGFVSQNAQTPLLHIPPRLYPKVGDVPLELDR